MLFEAHFFDVLLLEFKTLAAIPLDNRTVEAVYLQNFDQPTTINPHLPPATLRGVNVRVEPFVY